MENIYPGGASAGVVPRTAVVLVFLLLAGPFGMLVPAASAQILPDITIECVNSVDVDVSPGSTRTAVVNCELENASMWEEEVSLDISSEDLSATGPDSVSVPAGETVVISITVSADQDEEAGDYQVNVSAEIGRAHV